MKAVIREEKVIIPTYRIGEAERAPLFLEKRAYQGSSGKVYPLPVTEKIYDEKEDKEYNAIILENEYLYVMILPELGGRSKRTIGYVDDMYSFFKSLDGSRLVNYVSNSLHYKFNRLKDEATLHGDIAMWNDYLGLWLPCEEGDIERVIRETYDRCGDMPSLVSEFGLCEPFFKGGDKRRTEILKQRVPIYKTLPRMVGYMWFSLNDYRTHCGEEGKGRMKQRIHGSTDLYGSEKPSYRVLKEI